MEKLNDSGERTVFDTGAVRDIFKGKGRCDLLPLDVLSDIYTEVRPEVAIVFENLHNYIYQGDVVFLYEALSIFSEQVLRLTFPKYLIKIARHYESGAEKYSERNWEKGMETKYFLSSGIRHFLKYINSDIDEPHDLAFGWNILGILRMHKMYPDLVNYPIDLGNR